MKKTIQPITNSEQIADVATLAEEIWNERFVSIIGQEQVDYMLEKFQSAEAIQSQIDAGTEYYLAATDGHPTGYLAVIPNEPAGKMMLSKIYVHAASRGTGLGASLLEFAKNRAVETNAQSIWLTTNRGNTPAIEWYQRKGFVITDEVKKEIGSGFVMDDYILELSGIG
jgi:ribosomal protein S18 acetylase RimI-like enzyme